MPTQQLVLKDIHLPETFGWWPPALGWWLLLILIPLIGFFIVWLYRRITRKTALKTAKKLLLKISQDSELADIDKLIELSALIRRVAMSLAPRFESASLTGEVWLEYLDGTVNGQPFSQGVGRYLVDAHYQKNLPKDLDLSLLFSICENWLKAQTHTKVKSKKI